MYLYKTIACNFVFLRDGDYNIQCSTKIIQDNENEIMKNEILFC